MIDLNNPGAPGTNAVKQLRRNRLKCGFPFMISSTALPSNQSYLEYPGGRIALVTYSRNALDFTELRDLSPQEITLVRQQFSLDLVN